MTALEVIVTCGVSLCLFAAVMGRYLETRQPPAAPGWECPDCADFLPDSAPRDPGWTELYLETGRGPRCPTCDADMEPVEEPAGRRRVIAA